MSKQTWIIVIVIVALIAVLGLFFYMRQPAEQPASAPAPGGEIPSELQPMAEKAAGIAASTFHVPVDEVTVNSIQSVTWSDSSLGCPEEGKMYSQQLTEGYLATVTVSGATHSVHMNAKGQGLVCPPDQAKPPVSGN